MPVGPDSVVRAERQGHLRMEAEVSDGKAGERYDMRRRIADMLPSTKDMHAYRTLCV